MAIFKNTLRGVVLAVGLAGLTGAAQADDLSKITSADICPASLSSLSGAVGTVVSCWCPGSGRSGSIWGSGPYTVDSDLCGAARHAGAVPAAGGAIWVRIAKGESSYQGSTANGETTANYGAYGGSINIAARGAATAALKNCPANMQGVSGALACNCPAAATGAGPVWGTDIYTEDSSICRAAVHAGAIGANGGPVSIIAVGGQPSYSGSTRNGVKSSAYGSWGASYMFAN